jgi:hypothetical protein
MISPKLKKEKIQTFLNLLICLILILSIVQIFPEEGKLIKSASASSTWSETNWTIPGAYVSYKRLDFLNDTGDLKLFWGQRIYVGDTYNNRIVQTMNDGSIWNTYGAFGTGTGQFRYPYGVNFDHPSDYLYVADSYNHRIVKTKFGGTGWTTYGSWGSGTGQFSYPYDVHYDNTSGFLYIADSNNNRIVKTSITGTGWTTLGAQGSGIGEFSTPTGVFYDNTTGFVYVADYNNHRIVKTKMDGNGWSTLGSLGNGTGQFNRPAQIHYDKNTNYCYVTDGSNSRIVKTKFDGSGWATYGSSGSGKGKFNYPWGIDYDKKTDLIYVADRWNSRIVKTMINGSGWTSYGTWGAGTGQFSYASGIAVGEEGYCPDGFLRSKQYDLNGSADILSIDWVADTPPGTSIKIQLRTAGNQTDLKENDFVGPGGSSTNFYNTSGAITWGGHVGDQWLQYKVYLITNDITKTPVLKDVTIKYNILPRRPKIITPVDNSWTNDNQLTFSWMHNDSDSSSQNGFQWQVDDDKKFKSVNYQIQQTSTTQSSYSPSTPIPDGIWYWRLRTQDSDNGWGPYCRVRKILIDTEAPSSNINFPKNDRYYRDITMITGSASDPEIYSGVNRTEISIKSLVENKCWDGIGWSNEVTWLICSGYGNWEYNSSSVHWTSGSQYELQTRAVDNVTNTESPEDSIVFNIDTENPVSSIQKPSDNSSLNRVDKISGNSVDIGGSGVQDIEISIKRANDLKYWAGSSWVSQKTWLNTKGAPQWNYDSSSVSWTSGNEYLIQSRATDEIDHVEIPSKWIRFIFDTEEPSSIVMNPSDGAYLNQVNLITGNSTDPGGSGLDSVELTIKRKSDNTYWNGEIWDLDIRWLAVDGTSEWSLDTSLIPWTSDTYYAVSPRATDSAGNDRISGPGNSFMFDDTPPTQTVSINDEAVYTNLTSVELSLNSFDSGSGVSQMAFSGNGVDWSTWEPINSTKKFNLTGDDGSKIIYYKVQDRAGNIAKPAAGVIILDTTPPVSLVRINDNAAFTNSRDISLTLTATDILSDITNMSFSFDQETWTPKMPFNDFKTLTLPAGDGNKIVYFRVEDKAGNVAIVTDSILLDTAPPHSLTIVIDNGAGVTESTNVSLKVNALDDISGVAEMSFCTLIKPWSEWEEFKKSKPYEITPGQGEKIVFFKVKDKAGNEAPPISAKIIMNVTSSDQTRTTEDSQTFLNFWNVLIIVIIIIIILCVLAVISKRRKRAKLEEEQKLALEQAEKEKVIPPETPERIQAPVSTCTIGPTTSCGHCDYDYYSNNHNIRRGSTSTDYVLHYARTSINGKTFTAITPLCYTAITTIASIPTTNPHTYTYTNSGTLNHRRNYDSRSDVYPSPNNWCNSYTCYTCHTYYTYHHNLYTTCSFNNTNTNGNSNTSTHNSYTLTTTFNITATDSNCSGSINHSYYNLTTTPTCTACTTCST